MLRACTPAITMVIGLRQVRAAPAELLLVVPLLRSVTRSSFLLAHTAQLDLGLMTLDQLRRSSNHVPAARSGRTAATREVQQCGSDTYRQEWSDRPAHLGLAPAPRFNFVSV